MAELQSNPLRPTLEPVVTRGNVFWRNGERFFVKGIYYSSKQRATTSASSQRRPRIDPLTDGFLADLHRDIPILQELGMNTISVSHLNPQESHHHALQMLSEAGIYVLVNVLEWLRVPDASTRLLPNSGIPDPKFNTQEAYLLAPLTQTLNLVDQLAAYPNVLAFVVDADCTSFPSNTKMAEAVRAGVRDIRRCLRHRKQRRIPVGVSDAENLLQRKSALQYFSAGKGSSVWAPTVEGSADYHDDDGRVDFFALQSWSWAYRSSFEISGWKNMVRLLGEVPVPMILHAFGTHIQEPRVWEEVGCLFSRDMTGLFSGGIAFQFFEDGMGYGVVEIVERGLRKKKRRDFKALKQQMRSVNKRKPGEVHDGEVKDYESWVGEYPETGLESSGWHATADLPAFPGDWERLKQQQNELHVEGLDDRNRNDDREWSNVHEKESD